MANQSCKGWSFCDDGHSAGWWLVGHHPPSSALPFCLRMHHRDDIGCMQCTTSTCHGILASTCVLLWQAHCTEHHITDTWLIWNATGLSVWCMLVMIFFSEGGTMAPSASVLLMPLSYSTRAEAMYAVVVSHSILYVGMLHICIELQHVSFVLLACWHKLCIFPSTCMVPHLEDISCGMHM